VIGNPPFLGGKLMRTSLRDDYVDRLFAAFAGRVPAEADLVAYWFAKAWEQMREGRLKRAGLVGTNSMRGGANRRVLDAIVKDGRIFDAWDDEKWVVKGVAVRVSLICFSANAEEQQAQLDGTPVERIGSDLTASRSDLTTARPLAENKGIAFMGDTKGGAFDVPGHLPRQWLQLPLNPNGRPNSEVLRPWMNGMDATRRPADKWIIDFGWEMTEREAALYEAPFAYCLANVKPERDKLRREAYRRSWWRHVEPRPGMWRSLNGLKRYLLTPRVAKHRLFEWADIHFVPDSRLFVFATEDGLLFGLLHSRFHETWSLHTCSWHGVGNDPTYNRESVFGTFPFAKGLTPNIPPTGYADDPRAVAIAEAARRLDGLREAWLNPPDLVERVPEVVPGYPDRIVPVSPKAAAVLKTRTLTNLYNERPIWLDNAHRDLDAAVAAAYGWPADLSEEEALARLLALNLERAAAPR
jgi:type II restriction/modification system DNA methylase subunit YeeA